MLQKRPPIDDETDSPFWRAECIYCWNWPQEESEKKVIEKLHHETWCTYKKKEAKRFLKIIAPYSKS